MKMLRRPLIMIAVVLLAACAPKFPFVKQNPSFATRIQAIKEIAVFPPRAEFYRTIVGGEREFLQADATRIAKDIAESIADEFRKRGFMVKIKTDEAYRFLPSSLASFQVAELAGEAKADAVVLVSFTGFKRSGGSVAGEMTYKVLLGAATRGMAIIPQDPIGGAILKVALLDGATGESLWENTAGDSRFGFVPPSYDKTDLALLVSKLFEGYPK